MATKVNIIACLLNSGKTTLIVKLLTQSAANEHRAVLISEFSQLAIDGTFLEKGQSNIQIKQIQEGSRCCFNGIPFWVALSQLLAIDLARLLITRNIFGYPKHFLQLLIECDQQELISEPATIMEYKELMDTESCNNKQFSAHLQTAENSTTNKLDIYSAEQAQNYLEQFGHHSQSAIINKQFDMLEKRVDAPQDTESGSKRLVNRNSDAIRCLWRLTAKHSVDCHSALSLHSQTKARCIKPLLKASQNRPPFNSLDERFPPQSRLTSQQSCLENIHPFALSCCPFEKQPSGLLLDPQNAN